MVKLLNPLMNHRTPLTSMDPSQEIALELSEYGRTMLFAFADQQSDWDWDNRLNLIDLFSNISGTEFDDLLCKVTQCLLYVSELHPTFHGSNNRLPIGDCQLRWIEVFLMMHSKKPPINILLLNMRAEMIRLGVNSYVGKSVDQILSEV
jgi:hypothetical protein